MDQLVEAFTLNRVGKSGAKFDPDKAKWYNQQHLRLQPISDQAARLKSALADRGIDSDQVTVEKVCELVKEKAHFEKELVDQAIVFFVPPTSYDEKVVRKRWNDSAKSYFKKLSEILSDIDWVSEKIESTFRGTAEGMELSPERHATIPEFLSLDNQEGRYCLKWPKPLAARDDLYPPNRETGISLSMNSLYINDMMFHAFHGCWKRKPNLVNFTR